MKVVGLTGGIGSGKTTVAKMFRNLGIPIYIADDEAKALMNRSKIIRRRLVQNFGGQSYINGQLNRKYISSVVFKNPEALRTINAIVHPKVASHFKRWLKKQKSPYVIKEAAILFENGSYRSCDFMILVVADKKKRIDRVVKRDHTQPETVESIMKNQWDDQEKIKLSNFVIVNNDLEETATQVEGIHQKILTKIQ